MTKSPHHHDAAQRHSAGHVDASSLFGTTAPKRGRRWGVIIACATVALLIAGASALAITEYLFGTEAVAQNAPAKPAPAKQAPRPVPKQARAAAETEPSPDLFFSHAAEPGAKTCAPTYSALGKAVADGSQFTLQTQTSKTDTDRHAVQGVVGMSYTSDIYTGPATGILLAVPNGNSCEGGGVRVVPFTQNCQVAAGSLPKGSVVQTPLAATQVYALPGGGQAMLMPNGSACVVISILRAVTPG